MDCVIVAKPGHLLQPGTVNDTIKGQRPAVSRSYSDSPFGAGRSFDALLIQAFSGLVIDTVAGVGQKV